jgi:uncharacterized iron-regulated membrane protein
MHGDGLGALALQRRMSKRAWITAYLACVSAIGGVLIVAGQSWASHFFGGVFVTTACWMIYVGAAWAWPKARKHIDRGQRATQLL